MGAQYHASLPRPGQHLKTTVAKHFKVQQRKPVELAHHGEHPAVVRWSPAQHWASTAVLTLRDSIHPRAIPPNVPVLRQSEPEAILLTHHHNDHTGGVPELRAHFPHLVVYGPAEAQDKGITHIVEEGENILILSLIFFAAIRCSPEAAEDCLKARPAQMYQSLQKINALPDETLICCAHEYTLGNMKFAVSLLPEDRAIQDYYHKVKELRAKKPKNTPRCQSQNGSNVQQHAQSLSAAGQGEAGKFASSARWMDDGTSYAQDQDLWTSIGDELKMGIPENPRIREQKQKYLSNKSYLHDVTLRAEPYMYWIAGQVKKRNMPMELVLLPIVESAFDPHATSGANAAGIWQIIPSTGRNYGLKQTRNYDARRDVVASTTAALDMMQRLNKMFDGDWLLTVAAYNSGEGRVLKAMKANKARGKSTDFWSLSLPQETKIYVPKMLALSDILKNSKRYGVQLPTPDESRALARVRLSNPVDIQQVADMTGMSLRESLASGEIAAVQSTLIADASSVNSRSYKVRSGDTLSGIASRLGVNAKDLQQWNNLRSSGLKVGQTLTVGAGSSAQRLASNSDSITYRVRKGDSLSSIAKRHGVNIKDVMRWNNDTDNLKPGDQLTLFVKNSATPDS
ncbi:hypothetical protein L1887_60393 [Cichorium endivia]|nr:hypothetical protein L1887_60393 [Cichorium endivia]